MIQARLLAGLLLVAASMAYSRGFSNNPPAIPVQANVGFDIGEGAVNSFLHEAFKDIVTYGSGANRVRVAVKKAAVSLGQSSGTFNLEFSADYDLESVPKRATIVLTAPVNPASFLYTSSDGLQLVISGQLQAQMAGLPAYVQSVLNSRFSSVKFYKGRYDGEVTNASGTQAIGPRAQIDDKYPVFYMGAGQWQVSYHSGIVRVTLGPTMEREVPKVQFYRKAIGDPFSMSGEELKSEMTIITNFKGVIKEVGYSCGIACTRNGHTPNEVVTTGTFQMTKETGSDARFRRFNYVAPIVLDDTFSGDVTFWIILQQGNIEYAAAAYFKHNTNTYGSNHTSFYPDVFFEYNY